MTDALKSIEDDTVNFVNGTIESRYVRRSPEYFTAYLSSQYGCDMACRMCHLTQTGQTDNTCVTATQYWHQFKTILEHYATQPVAQRVHISFMARGEPLNNPNLNDTLLLELMNLAVRYKLIPRICISTIFPEAVDLVRRFPISKPDIYYSIYSTSDTFRKKWLPKAIPVSEAISILKEYQRVNKKIPTMHWAFIKNENDNLGEVHNIAKAIGSLNCNFNIVRYNPFNEKSREADLSFIETAAQYLRIMMPNSRVKIVDRVGQDVKASCGMFVQ